MARERLYHSPCMAADRYILEEYKARINRVVDFIERNLGRDLSLEDLAGIANFSKYHFHRIFCSMVGETLFHFVMRLRVEKAASFLAANPKMPMTEIASECGFADSAHFSRSFKAYFGVTPRAYRESSAWESNPVQSDRKFNQTFGNEGKSFSQLLPYNRDDTKSDSRRNDMEGKVEVREFPETDVAYVRYIGPYKGNAKLFENLYGKLYAWAGPRGLIGPEAKNIIVYHDNPEITAEDKLRVSVCLTVPKGTKVEGEVGRMSIPAGKYAFARFDLTPPEYEAAWAWVYGTWLPSSGWQCDDRPCFELYHGCDGGSERMTVDIVVPVTPR